MIVYDLACADGHVFEGWFGSSADYDGQAARGLLSCPMCGSDEVGKAAMAPAVPAKGNQGRGAVPMAGGAPARAKAVLAAMAKMQAEMLEKSDYVGRRFADEARAMHEGEQPARVIHGETSPAEAKALLEDGVPVAPLPLPVRPPGSEH